MTALKEFDRLESMGLWRASPSAQRRDVIVAVGDATLTISDQKGTALAHWSLPAMRRMNPGERPAIFGTDSDNGETLELDDDMMIAAIEKVRRVIERRRPHPGRLRVVLTGSVVAAFAALVLFWLPGAMINYAASVVPASKRAEIGRDLLANVRRVAGRPCSQQLGQKALKNLQTRLFGTQPGEIVVLSSGVGTSQHLPGHLILLNRSLVEDPEEAEAPAGYALVEELRMRKTDPMVRLLRDAGLVTAMRLLTTGDIPDSVLARHAENLLLQTPERIEPEFIIERFNEDRLRLSPYAYSVDPTGEGTINLIEADATGAADAMPALNDGDWVSLQGICGE